LLVLAARVGEIRLIDNALLAPPASVRTVGAPEGQPAAMSATDAAETELVPATPLAGAIPPTSSSSTTNLPEGEPTTCSA
jgi:hypothetical protein